MSSSDEPEPKFKLTKRDPKLSPPAYDIVLSEKQGLEIAELLTMPGWKVLKNVFAHQRKDHIARIALNNAQTVESLQYYKGMIAELQLFFLTIPRLKDATLKLAKEQEAKEKSDRGE